VYEDISANRCWIGMRWSVCDDSGGDHLSTEGPDSHIKHAVVVFLPFVSH